MRAVVLAGGRGTRLAPFTSILPKPLMPLGERSILEVVMKRIADCGIHDITLCVGHLSHLIRAVIENAGFEDVNVSFVQEHEALGTAGPLTLVDGLDDSFLVLNGDVLTTLDFTDLVRYHRDAHHVLTIAAHRRRVKIEYGVIHHETEGRSLVTDYDEKPELQLTVSMGVYVMQPAVLAHIPARQYLDFPDLVRKLLAVGLPVGAYLYDGLWFDIGLREDYERAVAIWEERDSAVAQPP